MPADAHVSPSVNVPTYSAAQVRAAEAPLLAAGIPLMRRAAQALAEVTTEVIAEHGPKRVLALAGAGNNGGDALFTGAELAASGARVDVLCTSDRVHEAGLRAAADAGARLVSLEELEPGAYDVVVDGILGIGARGALRGVARDAVSRLLPSKPVTIAVDLPSGLDPDTGDADAIVLPAATTVTFGAVTPGLVLGHGPALSGDIVLIDLGLELTNPIGRADVAEVRRR